jgi:hypothetical protein
MVEWLKKSHNYVLLVMNEQERARILTQHFTEEERPDYENSVITISMQLNSRSRGMSQRVIGIDNLDIILQNLVSPNQLGPVTVTGIEL